MIRLHYYCAPLLLSLHSITYAQSITLKILGINDFHGQISTGKMIGNRPVGGAAVLASYLHASSQDMVDHTLITFTGDQTGASPPASGLLNDEPTLLFFNSLGNEFCSETYRMNPQCNLVATLGNHEFDKGREKLMQLIYGNKKPPKDQWYPAPLYSGASFPHISANIRDAQTHELLFPPYVIKKINGISIAFIGAILKNAPDTMFPQNAEGIEFLDEAKSINHFIPEVKAQGADMVVVLLHEGGHQTPYEGQTKQDTKVEGAIKQIVGQLDDVAVVMGGHTHQFLNAYLPNHNGEPVLVTQANSYSASYSEVTLTVDSETHELQHKSARIITTYADQGPGLHPEPKTLELIDRAERHVAPLINTPLGETPIPLTRASNHAGETLLGDFIADSFKSVMHADIGMTNLHGLRDDIAQGNITTGNLLSVLPFANQLVTVTLTGDEIHQLLEQQWLGSYSNIIQISGLTYTYDPTRPIGYKVTQLLHDDKPLIADKIYSIGTTTFFASGAGVFSVMKKSQLVEIGPQDYEGVANYIKGLGAPIIIDSTPRITVIE